MSIQTYNFYQSGSIDGVPGTFSAGTAVDVNTSTMTVVATRPIGSIVPTIIQSVSGTVTMQGSPDGGVTIKYAKTASDGTLVTNATLQAGTALAGGAMTYREMVARALVGNVKILIATQALVNNGGSAAAAMSFTDQNGNSYSTVTNGKTLYIAAIDASVDMGGTTSAPLIQSTTVTISDGTNNKYKCIANSSSAVSRDLALMPTIASTLTLTVKASPSNLATAVGNVVCVLLAWEE